MLSQRHVYQPSGTPSNGRRFHGAKMMLRRYSFEIVLSLLLLGALIIMLFFL